MLHIKWNIVFCFRCHQQPLWKTCSSPQWPVKENSFGHLARLSKGWTLLSIIWVSESYECSSTALSVACHCILTFQRSLQRTGNTGNIRECYNPLPSDDKISFLTMDLPSYSKPGIITIVQKNTCWSCFRQQPIKITIQSSLACFSCENC
jgi:hypothetical protein